MKATTPLLSAVCLASLLPGSAPAQLTLVPAGSTWKYLDNGTDQGTAWRQSAFDDSAWASGPAQLGYGDGDEQTVVGFGPSSTAKYITTYFRRSFAVTDPTQLAGLKLEILRDDGAVIYLNGTEVARTNMPAGTVTATTPASSAVTGTDETTTFHSFTLNPSALLSGTNVLAVEIHQDSGASSDISFDLRLTDGVVPLGFVRSPYLQSVSPSAATIRWRTTIATDTRLRFGTAPGALDQTIVVSGSRTEHSVELSGLSPETRYYYAAGTSAGDLAGGEPYFVTTHPPAGTARKTRFWVLGDCGTGDANAIAVRNAFQQFNGNASTDLLLMLGDNAYNNGTDEEMTRSLFQIYPDTLRNTPLWPTLGNHDAVYSDSPTQTGPYFNSFTLPVNGSSGGVASGTEAYYSFDYANVHVICLDSQDTPRSTTGAMYQWLQNDLAATSQEWIIAFFHHPPYTKGTHDSDSSTDSSGRMTQMRSVFLPLLESYGVDLVLSGHSHTYERSFLLDGHYGLSSTFDAASMIRDNSGGDPDGSGTYVKRPIPRDGAVYVVAGSSGKVGTGTLNHPAMFVSMSKLGSLVLDVNGNELLARFITSTGTVADTFGIRHEEAPSTPTALTASASDASVALDWADNTEADLAGYDVLRATSADGTYSRLTTVTTSSWNDASVTNGTTYHYKVAAVDSYGYASEPTNPVSATPADTTPPAAPTGLAATAGNASVALDWTDSTEADLAGYRVFRSTVSGAGFSLVASPSASTFTDNSVSNGSTYFYTVAAIDIEGNASLLSPEVSATPADTTPPAAPTGLAATAGNASVALDWTDSTEADLAGYRVFRSTVSGSGFSLVASPSASTFTDNSVSNGTTYFYTVAAIDTAGNASLLSPEVSATPADTTPPAAPTGLAATAGNASVALDWTDSTEADLAGYRVFRSTVSGSGFSLVASPSASTFTDNSVSNGTTYFYTVAAIDIEGNASLLSPEVSATPADNTPPAAPTGLAATAGNASVALDWTDSTEADLAGYRVFRSNVSGAGFSLVASPSASTFTDNSVSNGSTYFYTVAAIDIEGNISLLSPEVSATPADTTPPAAPTGLAATAGNASVALDWTDSTEADLAGYRVFRSTVSGSGFSLVASPSASTFTDNSVSNGTTYFYTVAAIDTAGNISAPSSQISATPTAPLTAIWSERIDMGIGIVKGKYRASAGVNVLRSGNTAAARATVTGTWSLNGTVIGTASALTSRAGVATLYSPQVNATKGSTFTFTITGITLSGLQYNPALNQETSDSIAVP